MEKISKACSFFGHRNTTLTQMQKSKLQDVIEDLIVNHGVERFLLGSRSSFNEICHAIVTDLRNKYPTVKRYAYTCPSEACFLENMREYWEDVFSSYHKRKITFLGVEKEIEHKTKYTAGCGSYVERNQAMIDDSDYCIFYYNEKYLPQRRKISPKYASDYQPKSGTALAYQYANRRLRTGKILGIINLFEKT